MVKQTAYPSFLQAIGISFLLVILQLVGGLITGFLGARMGMSQNSPLMFFLNLYLLPVALGAIIICFYFWRSGHGWKDLWRAKAGTWLFYPIIIFMFVGLSFVLSEVDNCVRFFYPVTAAWEEIFTNIYRANIWLSFFGIAVIPPILEETVFRGIILRGFLNRYGLWESIVLSSFLFAAMHINIWQMIPAFIAGLFLGYIFYRTESLTAAIFAHAVNNATAVLGNHLFTIPGFNDGALFQPAWLTLGALGIVVLSLILFNYIHRRVTAIPDIISLPGHR
ncbi:MAG: type II CAAX endopeptidase family protein [Dethiobacteria bacterium]